MQPQAMWRCAAGCVSGAALLWLCWRRRAQPEVVVVPSAVTEAEVATLIAEMLQGLDERGSRALRWYGKRWTDGTTDIVETDPIPPRSHAILCRVFRQLGETRDPTVATIHAYYHARCRMGTGLLKGKRVGITPHTDDSRLGDAVAMLQVSGACDVWILNGAGQHKLHQCIRRACGDAVLLRGSMFSKMRHALSWPDDTPEDAVMVTITVRAL